MRKRRWIALPGCSVVVGFSPEGVPDAEATDETSFTTHGNSVSGEDFVSAVCAALGP